MFFDSFQPNSFNTHSPHRKLQRVTAHVVLGIPEGATRGVLRNFAKLTGKHLCQTLFFNKVAGLRLFLQNTSGRLLLAF